MQALRFSHSMVRWAVVAQSLVLSVFVFSPSVWAFDTESKNQDRPTAGVQGPGESWADYMARIGDILSSKEAGAKGGARKKDIDHSLRHHDEHPGQHAFRTDVLPSGLAPTRELGPQAGESAESFGKRLTAALDAITGVSEKYLEINEGAPREIRQMVQRLKKTPTNVKQLTHHRGDNNRDRELVIIRTKGGDFLRLDRSSPTAAAPSGKLFLLSPVSYGSQKPRTNRQENKTFKTVHVKFKPEFDGSKAKGSELKIISTQRGFGLAAPEESGKSQRSDSNAKLQARPFIDLTLSTRTRRVPLRRHLQRD